MNINTFQAELGIVFKNQNILKEALTHKSYLNENQDWNFPNNERFEFLGDAVLELITTIYLFKNHPTLEEGELTQIRAALVNTKMLASLSEGIGLAKALKVSKGERIGGQISEATAADAFEAFIGAIYLDQGYEAAERFIKKFVLSKTDDVIRKGVKDAKSLLQEKVQSELKLTPTYKILDETGPEHSKTFVAGVYFDHELIAKGKGQSKQEAELAAAEIALHYEKK